MKKASSNKTLLLFSLILLFICTHTFGNTPVLVGLPNDTLIGCQETLPPIPMVYSGEIRIHDVYLVDTMDLPDGIGINYISSLMTNDFLPGEQLIDTGNFITICLDIEHSYLGDLSITLISPSDSTIVLEDSHNGAPNVGVYLGEPIDMSPNNTEPGVGYEYCWTPTATNGNWFEYINNGGYTPYNTLPPDNYNSVDPLTNLLGAELNGSWTLSIIDDWAIDDGWMFGWSISFNTILYTNLNVEFSQEIIPVNCGEDILRTWFIVDTLGDTTSYTQTISRRDILGPELFGVPGDTILNCDATLPLAPLVIAVDACNNDTIPLLYSDSYEQLSCEDCYFIHRCWEATDNCGNSTEYCQDIMVSDFTPPLLENIPSDLVLDCGDSVPPIDSSAIVGIDNCDTDVHIIFEEQSTGNSCDTILRIFTAVDNAGLTYSDTQYITFGPLLNIFNPGATWVYGFTDGTSGNTWEGYETWTYMGATEIEGVLLQEVQRVEHVQLEQGLVVENELDPYYYYVEGNKVYGIDDIHRSIEDYNTVMYDFDAGINDEVQINQTIRLRILNETPTNLDNTQTATFKAQILCNADGNWVPQNINDTLEINSRIGAMNYFNMFRHACYENESNKYYTLRCYHDNEVSLINFTNTDCEYVNGIVKTNQVSLIDDYKIYPNPISDYLTVKSSISAKITLYDINGKTQLTQNIMPGQTILKTKQLSQGVYYFKLNSKGRSSYQKLIKQ